MNNEEFVCFRNGWDINKKVLLHYEGKSKEVVIPSQFETIEMSCFWKNYEMESLVIPDSVKLIKGQAFFECPNLKSVKISGNLYGIAPDTFGDPESTAKILKSHPNYIEKNGFIINKSNNSLLFVLDNSKESYTIPEGIEYIGYSCFFGCVNLKEITIPESVHHIEMMAFFCCENLRKIDFPKELKYIGIAAFSFCRKLEEFTLPEIIAIKYGNDVLIKN